MPPVGDHTDHVIFMNNHTGHQYIIPRRGRDEIRTGSKMKMIFINPSTICRHNNESRTAWCQLELRIKFYPMANVTEQVVYDY